MDPSILAGLGVSGGLLLLANRNIPALNIPILSSAADRGCLWVEVLCFRLKIHFGVSFFLFFRCSSMDWSGSKYINWFLSIEINSNYLFQGISMVTAVWCVIGVRAKCKIFFILFWYWWIHSCRWNWTSNIITRRQSTFTTNTKNFNEYNRIISHIYCCEIGFSFRSRSE